MKLLLERIGATEQGVQGEKQNYKVLYDEIREEFLQSAKPETLRQKNDPHIQQQLYQLIEQITKSKAGKIPGLPVAHAVKEIANDVLGYGPITDLLNDPDIEEIMVNRYDKIFYEKDGVIYSAPDISFRDEEHLMQVIFRIVDSVGRRIDESSPYVDARLPDGSRINAVIPPVSADGACLNVRKFKHKLNVDEMLANETFPQKYLRFFEACVQAKLNIMITGGSGVGKTSFLNFLSTLIDDRERLVTIEDDLELNIKKNNLVRMESRGESAENTGAVMIRDLVVNALRMRPDRIIVGEVRSSEVIDMLQAMNTGHDGSMSTGHANSPEDMLIRMENMAMVAGTISASAVRRQIASGIDLIIHLSRHVEDGSRKVTRIVEVTGIEDEHVTTSDIMKFRRDYGYKDRVKGDFEIVASQDSAVMQRLALYNYS